MTWIRLLLFPIVPIYFGITWLRNWLYDLKIKPSKSYDFPVICVGNLSTGGTGKTPMIEYIIRLLKDKAQVATLSRGYKRQSKGFVLADTNVSVETIGDEPFQFYTKFKNITVAVDTDRQNGITELRRLKNKPDVILLDDAYQHRKVKAGFSILLTAYNSLYSNDIVLPTGNLREPRSGAKRANIVVVTKCPKEISDAEKKAIASQLKLRNQALFFSHINYGDNVYSKNRHMTLKQLPKFTLVTGIANAKPLIDYLNKNNLDFEHLKYADHYNFKPSDIKTLETKALLITTEKDYMRLSEYETLSTKLYYLPIEFNVDNSEEFEAAINNYFL